MLREDHVSDRMAEVKPESTSSNSGTGAKIQEATAKVQEAVSEALAEAGATVNAAVSTVKEDMKIAKVKADEAVGKVKIEADRVKEDVGQRAAGVKEALAGEKKEEPPATD